VFIEKAINGNLELDELNKGWPEETEGIPFYEAVFEDIESAVEHFPSSLFGNPIDRFKSEDEYRCLQISKLLISDADLSIDEKYKALIELRKNAISSEPEKIKEKLNDFKLNI